MMKNNEKIVSWWKKTLLVAAYVIPMYFFCYSYLTNEGHWFSRSGSIMVILGAFLEYRNFAIQQYLREKRDATWKPDPILVDQLKSRKPFDVSILASLVFGTAIWGYGDLLFNNT